MSNTNTNTQKNTKAPSVADYKKQIKDKDLELKATRKEFEELKLSLQLMQKQLLNIPNAPQDSDEEILVGCNMYSGGTIISRDGGISYKLKYKEVLPIPHSELKECFRSITNNYRQLFKEGVFYFVDEDQYKKFKVSVHIDLSDTAISEKILGGEIPYFNEIEMGNGRKNFNVYYATLYRVADVFSQGKLSEWKYEDREKFENYFGKKMNDVVSSMGEVTKL